MLVLHYFLISNDKKAGRTKIALARKIDELFGAGYTCDPNELLTNKGANNLNDWCSWTGTVRHDNGHIENICSWTRMGELVSKKDPLVIIDKVSGEIA